MTIHKRHALIPRFLDAFASQTHACTEVWVTAWHAPKPAEVERITRAWQTAKGAAASNVKLVLGDTDLAYFGRFQMGLQLNTPYAIFFDDDCIPGSRFLELCMHTIGTEPYRALLGIKGHRSPYPPRDGGLTYFGPVAQTRTLQEADVVGGAWVVEQEWVKLMFRDRVISFQSGEDYQLTYGMRKYAGRRAFVLPTHSDPAWCGTTSKAEYEAISAAGDSTGGDGAPRMEARKFIEESLYYRGIGRIFSHTSWTGPGVMFVVDSCVSEGATLTPLLQAVRATLPGMRVMGVSSGRETDCGISWLAKHWGLSHDRFWDTRLGWDVPGRRSRPIDWLAEMGLSLDGVIDAANPQYIVHCATNDAVALAVVHAAHARDVVALTLRIAPPDSRSQLAVDALSDAVLSPGDLVSYLLRNQ